jgi:hypothetical protein
MSNSTKNILSNQKANIDLPKTQDLFISGTTVGDEGKPMVYHSLSKKLSLGDFPTPDSSYLRYRSLTVKQAQDNQQGLGTFNPGWFYLLTDSQKDGGIFIQAVGLHSLAEEDAYQVVQVLQQGGGFIEQLYPVSYELATDTISPRQSGGDTVIHFEQDRGKLTLTTDQGSFVTDLNIGKNTLLGSQILADPDFYLQPSGNPSGGIQWASSSGWSTSNGVAYANNGDFCYQDVTIPVTGLYQVEIEILAVSSGVLQIFITQSNGQGQPQISTPGVYTFYTNLNAGSFRFHLRGQNGFVGEVNYCRLQQIQLGAVYGDDRFVHNSGDEQITGLKTFATGVDSQSYSLSGFKGLSYNPINGSLISLTLGSYAGIARITYAGQDHEWLLTTNGTLGMKLDVGGNLYVQNGVTATHFIGDGQQLTNLPYYYHGNPSDLNIAQGKLGGNTFSGSYTRNRFGNNTVANTLGDNFYHNTIEDNFIGNNIGRNFQEHHIGYYFTYNNIGDNVSFCTFHSYTTRNNIGNNCSYLTFSNYCNYNTIGDNCSFIELYNCYGLNIPSGTTNAVYKNNVQIYPVQNTGSGTPKYAPEFTAMVAGTQSITTPTAGTVIQSITVKEASTLTRTLYPENFSISGTTVTITADENIVIGDKIKILYQ